MRAGKLDREIVVQRGTEASDEFGGISFTWSDLVPLRAQLVQASTEEFMRNYGPDAEALTIFRTRYFDGITTADRVVYAGEIHDIRELKEIGRREGLEIRTVGTGEAP